MNHETQISPDSPNESTAPGPGDGTAQLCRDAGSTLIEIIVSIVLLGTIVAALSTATYTMITTSSNVYELAQIETVLLNAADQVERAEPQCDYDVYVQAAALAEGWPADALSVSVEILDSNTGNPGGDWAAQDCAVALEAFDVQRLVIRAEHPFKDITRSLTVIKSDVGN